MTEEEIIDNSIQCFFEIEVPPGEYNDLIKGEEEHFCVDHIIKTYTQDKTRRFIVQMPIKNINPLVLGESK